MAKEILLTDGQTHFSVPAEYAESLLKTHLNLRAVEGGLDVDEVRAHGGVSHGHISNFPLKSIVARPKDRKHG